MRSTTASGAAKMAQASVVTLVVGTSTATTVLDFTTFWFLCRKMRLKVLPLLIASFARTKATSRIQKHLKVATKTSSLTSTHSGRSISRVCSEFRMYLKTNWNKNNKKPTPLRLMTCWSISGKATRISFTNTTVTFTQDSKRYSLIFNKCPGFNHIATCANRKLP